jgi:hypothetical protein
MSVYYVWVLAGVAVSGYYDAYRANLLGSLGFSVFGWWMWALGHDAGHFAISTKYPLLVGTNRVVQFVRRVSLTECYLSIHS